MKDGRIDSISRMHGKYTFSKTPGKETSRKGTSWKIWTKFKAIPVTSGGGS
jgi:hypothetical protein